MKFDLFDSLNIMEKHFDDNGEILLSQNNSIIQVRLRVFDKDIWHNAAFTIDKKEIYGSFDTLMNLKFYKAIQTLKRLKRLKKL